MSAPAVTCPRSGQPVFGFNNLIASRSPAYVSEVRSSCRTSQIPLSGAGSWRGTHLTVRLLFVLLFLCLFVCFHSSGASSHPRGCGWIAVSGFWSEVGCSQSAAKGCISSLCGGVSLGIAAQPGLQGWMQFRSCLRSVSLLLFIPWFDFVPESTYPEIPRLWHVLVGIMQQFPPVPSPLLLHPLL